MINFTLNAENLNIPMIEQALGGNPELFLVLEASKLVKVGRKMVTVYNITYAGTVKVIK